MAVDAPQANPVGHLPLRVPRLVDVGAQGVSVGRGVEQRPAGLLVARSPGSQDLGDLVRATIGPASVDQPGDLHHVARNRCVLELDRVVGEVRQRLLGVAERVVAAEPGLPFQQQLRGAAAPVQWQHPLTCWYTRDDGDTAAPIPVCEPGEPDRAKRRGRRGPVVFVDSELYHLRRDASRFEILFRGPPAGERQAEPHHVAPEPDEYGPASFLELARARPAVDGIDEIIDPCTKDRAQLVLDGIITAWDQHRGWQLLGPLPRPGGFLSSRRHPYHPPRDLAIFSRRRPVPLLDRVMNPAP